MLFVYRVVFVISCCALKRTSFTMEFGLHPHEARCTLSYSRVQQTRCSQGPERSGGIILSNKLWFLKERWEEDQPQWKSTYFVHIHVHLCWKVVFFSKRPPGSRPAAVILTNFSSILFKEDCLRLHLPWPRAQGPGTLNQVPPMVWVVLVLIFNYLAPLLRWQLNSDASQ